MNIQYVYNDIDSVNKIYSTFDKQDKYFVNAGRPHRSKYIINPKGDFATKYIKEDDFGIIITMMMDDIPVAYACCMRAYDTDKKEYTTECDIDFGVHKDYRHRGFGKKIISHLLSILKRYNKYQTINWYTLDENKSSNALASKFGFKYVDSNKNVKHYVYTKR